MSAKNNTPALTCCYKAETPETQTRFYDGWAQTYDKEMQQFVYNGPKYLAEMVQKYVQDKNARILDICAGTGMEAHLMKRFGFTNMDAHDGSKEMLAKAKKQNLYKNYIHELFYPHKSAKNIEKRAYDAVIAIGTFSKGHLTHKNLNIFLEAAKPGALIIFGLKEVTEYPEFLAQLKTYENEGKWKLVAREIFENYRLIETDKNETYKGVYYVFKVL